MSINFHLKRALVTGAGKGIGRGIALKLATLGAKVHAISRTQSDLDNLRKESGDIKIHNVDIGDWDKTSDVVKNIGPIDMLVNNAAVVHINSFLEGTKHQLDDQFDINFKAVYNISQLVARGMVERGHGGSIVNISSSFSFRPGISYSVYSASKAAMDMLTRSMAVELGPHNIRVNSICAGIVITPMLLKLGDIEETRKRFAPSIPLRRLTEVDEIVHPTIFLLSDQASIITGAVLVADGGISNAM